jgi:hypothetical protein
MWLPASLLLLVLLPLVWLYDRPAEVFGRSALDDDG